MPILVFARWVGPLKLYVCALVIDFFLYAAVVKVGQLCGIAFRAALETAYFVAQFPCVFRDWSFAFALEAGRCIGASGDTEQK